MSNSLSPDPNQNLLPSTSFSALNWNPQEPNPAVILQSDLLIGHINQNPNIPAVTPNPSDSLLLAPIEGSIATIDPNITLPNDNSFDGLTGEAMDIVKEQLTQFAKVPNFVEKMNLAFGESWDNQAANVLTQDWLNGDFSLIPPVKFVSSAEIAVANGAFAQATNTIYLSQKFLRENGTNSQAVADVLLEEIGHSIDSKINVIDSPGDEGEIFASIVQGQELSLATLDKLKSENDQAPVTIDDESLIIENNMGIGINQILSSSLSTTDPTNPTRGIGGYYKDDYSLTGITAGQPVKVNLNSSAFDAYLQIINQSTGTVVTQNDDANGTNNSEVILTPQSGVNYLVRVTSYSAGATGAYSIVTSSNLSKPTVSLSATDSSAAETTSGQTANPGRFTVTRTGITTNPLTVYYTTGGAAIKGTDYQNLIGSVTIPAGLTTATIPINVIDDTLVESSETAIVNLSANTNYNLGTTSGTVTIADNDVVTKPTVSLTTTDSSAAETISGQTANPGQFTFTRTGLTTNPLTVYYTTGGTATKGTDYQNLLGSVTIPAGLTTATIPINVIDDTLVEGSETVIVNLSANTNYYSGSTSNYIDLGNTSGTVTIADNDVSIPVNSWRAEYFNNNYLAGTPVFSRSESLNSLNYNWGSSGPGNGLNNDNFSTRWTGVFNFDAGNYTFKQSVDDGMRVWVNNNLIHDTWNGRNAVNYSKDINMTAGQHTVKVEYKELGGDALAKVSWEKAGNRDIDIQLSYPNGGFTQSEINLMEKASQNWERIITKDKDSSGVLKISVVKAPTSDPRYVAETFEDSSVNYRTNFQRPDVDINGVDYHNNIRFNPNHFSRMVNGNLLVQLTMHEIGHTLGLGHEGGYSLMEHNNFYPQMTNSMYNTMNAKGYNVDRNVTINWS